MTRHRARHESRPTLYLPVEVKVREFAPKLLIAALAAARGWRVYVGSKVGITAAIHADRPRAGVYFSKGGDRPAVLEDAKHRCERLVVQDEEIGPGMTPEEVRHAWRTRYSPQINRLIDQIYVYSDEHLAALGEIWPDLADKASVTGWPRFDLWQPGFRNADERRARHLRARYGDFVLFCSRFKVNTPEQRDHRLAVARGSYEQLPVDARDDTLARDDYGSKATERYDAFLRCVPILRQIAETPDAPSLVVRPHPSEDPAAWREAFAADPRIVVAFEGEVGPWILASRAMLHTASTTAVQADEYGVAVGYLAEVGYPPAGANETESVRRSVRLDSVTSAQEFIRAHRPQPLDTGARATPGAETPPVTLRIVTALGRFKPTAEPPVPIGRAHALGSRLNARYKRLKRSRWAPSWLAPTFEGTNAQAKLPGGLPARDARWILDDLPLDSLVHVSSVRSNLLRVEARDDDGQFAGTARHG